MKFYNRRKQLALSIRQFWLIQLLTGYKKSVHSHERLNRAMLKIRFRCLVGIRSFFPFTCNRENRITEGNMSSTSTLGDDMLLFSRLIRPPFRLIHVLNNWSRSVILTNKKMENRTGFLVFYRVCNVHVTYCANKMHNP